MFTRYRGAGGAPKRRELYSRTQCGRTVQGLRTAKEAMMTVARTQYIGVAALIIFLKWSSCSWGPVYPLQSQYNWLTPPGHAHNWLLSMGNLKLSFLGISSRLPLLKLFSFLDSAHLTIDSLIFARGQSWWGLAWQRELMQWQLGYKFFWNLWVRRFKNIHSIFAQQRKSTK